MPASLWGERLAGVAFILLAIYMGNAARNFPAGGSTFPLFISALTIVISVIMIARTFLSPADYDRDWRPKFTLAALKPIVITALIIGYVLVIFRVGYYASTFILLVALPFALGLRRPFFIICSAVGATAFLYALFELGLRANMPSGALF